MVESHNQWLYDLPKNSTKSVAHALKQLCRQIYPMDTNKEIIGYLYNIVRINKRAIKGWLQGQIFHPRGVLTIPHFQTLVTHFVQSPNGLTTWNQVRAFAELFGEPYIAEISRTWGLEAYLGERSDTLIQPESDARYPQVMKLISRPFLDEIVEKIQLPPARPLIIWGHPGMGKTTLMHQLQTHPKIRDLFGNNILAAFLGGKSLYSFLRPWLLQLWPNIPNNRSRARDDKSILHDIRQILRKRNFLIILDDVSQPQDVADLLSNNLTKGSVVVFTTNDRDTAESLKSKYDGVILDISPFGEDEACRQYENILGHPVAESDRENLSELVAFLRGNPLGLHLAFHRLQEKPFDEYMQFLKSKDHAVPAEFTPEIYLPLQVAYEHMDDTTKSVFLSLAAFPYLYSYDLKALALVMDPENSHDIVWPKVMIRKLNRAMGALIPVNNDDEWRIHQQVWQFARFVAEKTDSKTEWLEKALHRKLDQQAIPQKPKRPFREQLQLALKFKRPRKFEPKQKALVRIGKIFRYSDYVTEWDIISENTAILASREFVRGYRLYKWELRQRSTLYLFVYGLGAILILGLILRILSTFITAPVFTQIWESFYLISTGFLYLILIFVACFVLYNAILEINWNLLFTAIAERINASED